MSNWIPLNNKAKYDLMDSISANIAKIENMERDFLPNLRTDSQLLLISDYAGKHKQARFHILSYLLADSPGTLRIWDHKRKAIRQEFLQDGRRIAFKQLGDKQKQKALGPFLASASFINGVLFCVAIDKRIKSISFDGLPSRLDIAKWSQLPWSPRVFERLIRVLHFGSFLVAGLYRPGQDLHWIMDEDEIIANEHFQQDVCRIGGRMFQHYCPHGMGHLAYGISGKFDDERRAEDLVSIVDLVAGALSEDLSSAITEEYSTSSKISVPVLRRISLKSQLIIFWLWNLCGPRTPLKKMICLIRPTKNGKLVFSFLNRTTMPGIMEPLWLPLNKDWEQSIKSWQLYATTHR